MSPGDSSGTASIGRRMAPCVAPGGTAVAQVILFLTCTRVVQAHAGESHVQEAWWSAWSAWNWDPIILFNLGLLSWLYASGLSRMWRRAGVGRGVSRGQAMAFGGGMIALVIALLSPLDALSDQLSAAHMVQHMMLMLVAAPLFVLGAPAVGMLWGAPPSWRQAAGRWRRRIESWRSPWYLLWQPLLLWSLYALTLWVWHLPALYQAALRNRFIHEFQHLSFFVAACLFWRVLLDPISRLRLSRGLGVLYVFTTSLHATALGVFMALSLRPWYPEYEGKTIAWNLTALEDQQIAGLIMWMPACMIYAVSAAAIFGLWLYEFDREPARR